MNLQMRIFVVRKNNENNYKELMEAVGMREFAWLKNWIGDNRNGECVRLDADSVRELLDAAIENERHNKSVENNFAKYVNNEDYIGYYMAKGWTNLYGTEQAVAILSLWKAFNDYGWFMDIKCDWEIKWGIYGNRSLCSN